jgi:hypothetical protein
MIRYPSDYRNTIPVSSGSDQIKTARGGAAGDYNKLCRNCKFRRRAISPGFADLGGYPERLEAESSFFRVIRQQAY